MRGLRACWAVLVLALAAAFAVSAAAPAFAQQGDKRFALVIGNSAYSGALTRLANPGVDADRIAGALSAVGFSGQVAVRKDQGRTQILNEARALADRLRAAGPEAVGFFYYSGHGGSAVEGDRRRNYLIPVGAPVSKADDLVAEGVPLDSVVAILSAAKARAVFIVFDACRNELPWSKGGDDADKAFGAVPARPGLFIAFATDQGATAPDDGAFAQAIASEIVRPGVKHLDVFDNAARAVARRRATDRLPWYSNQIYGDPIYFKPVSARLDPAPLAFDPRAADTAYWQGCCSAADAGMTGLKAYLAKVRSGEFPGLFKDLAERRLMSLSAPPPTVLSNSTIAPGAALPKREELSVLLGSPKETDKVGRPIKWDYLKYCTPRYASIGLEYHPERPGTVNVVLLASDSSGNLGEGCASTGNTGRLNFSSINVNRLPDITEELTIRATFLVSVEGCRQGEAGSIDENKRQRLTISLGIRQKQRSFSFAQSRDWTPVTQLGGSVTAANAYSGSIRRGDPQLLRNSQIADCGSKGVHQVGYFVLGVNDTSGDIKKVE